MEPVVTGGGLILQSLASVDLDTLHGCLLVRSAERASRNEGMMPERLPCVHVVGATPSI
jgi:hypothetical protein